MRLVLRPTIYGDTGPLLRKLHHKMEAEGLSEEEEKTWKEARAPFPDGSWNWTWRRSLRSRHRRGPVPKKARILASLTCESCGEPVMETRTRRFNDQVLCIPCFESFEKRF